MLFHLLTRSFSFPAEPQRRNAETTPLMTNPADTYVRAGPRLRLLLRE